jgi:hypothetical protein
MIALRVPISIQENVNPSSKKIGWEKVFPDSILTVIFFIVIP